MRTLLAGWVPAETDDGPLDHPLSRAARLPSSPQAYCRPTNRGTSRRRLALSWWVLDSTHDRDPVVDADGIEPSTPAGSTSLSRAPQTTPRTWARHAAKRPLRSAKTHSATSSVSMPRSTSCSRISSRYTEFMTITRLGSSRASSSGAMIGWPVPAMNMPRL